MQMCAYLPKTMLINRTSKMSAYPKVSKVLRYVDALRGVVIVGFKAHTKKFPHCGGLK